MPITESAKKALRQSVKRAARNKAKNERMKDALRNFEKLVAQGKTKEAQEALPALFSVLDKTAKAGVIKKNTASRLKSRLSRSLAKKTPAS